MTNDIFHTLATAINPFTSKQDAGKSFDMVALMLDIEQVATSEPDFTHLAIRTATRLGTPCRVVLRELQDQIRDNEPAMIRSLTEPIINRIKNIAL